MLSALSVDGAFAETTRSRIRAPGRVTEPRTTDFGNGNIRASLSPDLPREPRGTFPPSPKPATRASPLYSNFLSMEADLADSGPSAFSSNINPILYSYLAANPGPANRLGVLNMDFPDEN